jgi:hypothetical protein
VRKLKALHDYYVVVLRVGGVQAELIGHPLYAFNGMDTEAKLELVQQMMEVPPSKLSKPVTIANTFRLRHRAPVRIETQHQTVWIDSSVRPRPPRPPRSRPRRLADHLLFARVQPKWHLIVFQRVLEEGLTHTLVCTTVHELLTDPLTRRVIDARLAFLSRTRTLDEINPLWRGRAIDLYLSIPRSNFFSSFCSPHDPTTSSSSPSSSMASPPLTLLPSPSSSSTTQDSDDAPFVPAFVVPAATHERSTGQHRHATNANDMVRSSALLHGGPEGFDLDEVLGTLRSPLPSPSLTDDPARWLQGGDSSYPWV